MIVPRTRLLFWTAAVTMPLSLFAAIAPETAPFCVLLVSVFGAAVIADGWLANRSVAGIALELPPVIRTSKDRASRFQIRIKNEVARQRSIRLGFAWPPQISAPEALDVDLPHDARWSHLEWTCTPARRGKYPITSAFVEGGSPVGFWAARRAISVTSEVRVYPNLMEERRKVAALFLNRGAFGIHAQRQVGQGRDFEKLREYVAGDGFDEIHWKATARRGKPITKLFQIERTQEVYVVIDASRLSTRDAGGTPLFERIITAALVLGLAAERQGDLFGLLVFSDKIERFVRAKNGKVHYGVCRDALYTLHARSVTPDFDELWSFLRLRLRRRALIVFLTSLDDPALADSFIRNVNLIRLQHFMLVNMIRQPGVRPLFTDSKVSLVDDLYEQLAGHLQWQKLRRVQKALERRGVQFSLLENERLSTELVSQYFSVKQRQLL